MPARSQQDRRDATRAALLQAGRRLFADRGFAAVPADDIVAAAGVTRGALHHHFKDKRGLFRSVFEQLEAEIAADLGGLLADGRGDLLRRSLSAFLDICERSDVRRIALTDAPAVLGWKTWREIESEHGLGLLTALLAETRGTDGPAPVHMHAQLILSSVIEGALFIANAENQTQAREQVESSLIALFGHLMD
ncbi:TetR/AcrR family transcriptional regulator [Actinokineospora sp. NBRC 105648]|uniref:TetR/AcrR family transcriptional regulator n=1 Tax=Actinokineospora sp. NBRC 105648 TaxID=3032206 RepID=UPI00249FFEF1|nr:TetR/AcrR family transcriptional regulator [Actinokineospora sp. NBRC 105648]GLZ37945.1 TetR family transcriptional regulator [Actinokineospora sp. NBRC 105648]